MLNGRPNSRCMRALRVGEFEARIALLSLPHGLCRFLEFHSSFLVFSKLCSWSNCREALVEGFCVRSVDMAVVVSIAVSAERARLSSG
jgi:hypothetical protein